ncbi:hypothetical protein IFO70_07870 [Phormidium tenue FACHB-886]|nr:hypothetical protein [Phormidium tenue FACHB-886]
MMVTLLILLLGFTPFLFSVWFMRQANARAQARLQLAIESVSTRRLSTFRLPPEHQYVEGIGFMIGDLTCRFNARSSYIRCAVNPIGPCQTCSHYQPKE